MPVNCVENFSGHHHVNILIIAIVDLLIVY